MSSKYFIFRFLFFFCMSSRFFSSLLSTSIFLTLWIHAILSEYIGSSTYQTCWTFFFAMSSLMLPSVRNHIQSSIGKMLHMRSLIFSSNFNCWRVKKRFFIFIYSALLACSWAYLEIKVRKLYKFHVLNFMYLRNVYLKDTLINGSAKRTIVALLLPRYSRVHI